MNIDIFICKTKFESFYEDGLREYQKRLGVYCKIKMIQIKSEKELDRKIKKASCPVCIDQSGESLSSVEFSSFLQQISLSGISDFSFFIGFSQYCEALEGCRKLALVKTDMGSALLVLTLHEQIYRAFRILHNEPYHK